MKNKRKEAITMSNEWKMVRLGDICEYIRNGANIKQYDNAGGTPITRIETLSNDKFNRDRLGYADIADDKYSKYYLNNHDILMSHINSEKYLGRAVLYTKESEDETIIHGMNLLSLRTLKDKGIAPFLVYYFATVSFKSQIAKISKKSVNQASFSVSCLNKVNIPLPSIKRQREIAAVLDKARELVEKRKAQLAELDRLAESVFYDMFGNPVTNEKGWSHKTLSELGDWKSGGTPSRNNSGYFCGDTPWVSSGGLNNMYIVDTNEHITEDAILNSNTKKIKVGAILLGMYDTAALKSSITKRIMCCNQAIAYSRLEDNVVDTLFVYTVIQICKDEYKKLQRGIRQKNLNLSMIKAISIIYPPLSLQQQFAERIEKIEKQKTKVQAAIKESENLFQRLMQDMFNPEYHNS